MSNNQTNEIKENNEKNLSDSIIENKEPCNLLHSFTFHIF